MATKGKAASSTETPVSRRAERCEFRSTPGFFQRESRLRPGLGPRKRKVEHPQIGDRPLDGQRRATPAPGRRRELLDHDPIGVDGLQGGERLLYAGHLAFGDDLQDLVL